MNRNVHAMRAGRDELRAKASEHGWVLAYSCRTLDQFTLTPAEGGKAQREVAVYFSADDGVVTAGYETYWESGRFLGRPVPASGVLGVMLGGPPSACPRRPDHLGDTA